MSKGTCDLAIDLAPPPKAARRGKSAIASSTRYGPAGSRTRSIFYNKLCGINLYRSSAPMLRRRDARASSNDDETTAP